MVPNRTEPRRGITTRLKMWGRGARGSINNTFLIGLAMTTLLTASPSAMAQRGSLDFIPKVKRRRAAV
jgi:hypothetical protein